MVYEYDYLKTVLSWENIFYCLTEIEVFIMKQKYNVSRLIFKFGRICFFCNSAKKWSWNIKMIVPKFYKPETISSSVALKLKFVVHIKNVQNRVFLEIEYLEETRLRSTYRLNLIKNGFFLSICFKNQNFDMCFESWPCPNYRYADPLLPPYVHERCSM